MKTGWEDDRVKGREREKETVREEGRMEGTGWREEYGGNWEEREVTRGGNWVESAA